jgi:hypothetical protein
VRRCVNPAHLFLGTRTDNAADRDAKGRTMAGIELSARIKGKAASGERHGSHTHPERVARGERAGSSRLTASLVTQVRDGFASGKRQAELMREYGLTRQTVFELVRRKTWTHLP